MSSSPIPSAAAQAPVPSDAAKRLLPWLVAVAFFMESLDTTILNTAVPAISAALSVTPLSMKAVLASYTLSLAVFIPISGWMADRFGTRRVFASAIGLFTLGSLLCGISSNIHLLVACRVLQGCGGAMMVPVGRLTLVRTFAKSELIRAMSFVVDPGADRSHARARRRRPDRRLLPLARHLLPEHSHRHRRPVSWSTCTCPTIAKKTRHPLDLVGLVLFGSGIALLSYVLEVFGEHTLSAAEIIGLLVLSVALLAGYWLHARALRISAAAPQAFRHSHLPRSGERQLLHAPRHRRRAVSASAALSDRSGLHARFNPDC